MISGRLVGVLGANVRRQAARIRRRSGPSTERRGGSDGYGDDDVCTITISLFIVIHLNTREEEAILT
jgi:hypothetical protein